MTNNAITKSASPLPDPGPDLWRAVNGAVYGQGSKWVWWCHAHQLHAPNTRSALLGLWRGPKATARVELVLNLLGLVAAPRKTAAGADFAPERRRKNATVAYLATHPSASDKNATVAFLAGDPSDSPRRSDDGR